MRELTMEEVNSVSGGAVPAVVAGAGAVAVYGLAAVGAFGAGYALGTFIRYLMK